MNRKDTTLFAVGQKVRLESFNDSFAATEDCKPENNHWMLIGQAGEVVAAKNDGQRVLVTFDVSVASFCSSLPQRDWQQPFHS
jgi:hypothetical protein